ncbi:MAG: septum formation family protein [Rhodocyclaceae bacterium]
MTSGWVRTFAGVALAATVVACSGETPEGDKMSVFTMAFGKCYNLATVADAEASQISDIRLIDCEQPHRFEVYHIHRLADATFPGEAALTEAAENVCEANFADYVGTAYDESIYYYNFYTPTLQGWRQDNDREIVCTVETEDGSPITGSVRGSKV